MKYDIHGVEEIDTVAAARIVEVCVRRYKVGCPKTTLGLATGRTFEGVYQKLVEILNSPDTMQAQFDMTTEQTKDMLSRLELFGLDEYASVPADDPNSYAYYYQRRVVEPLGLRPEQMHVPRDGNYLDGVHIDFQLLGIGVNGHIGFNEPKSYVNSTTRLVKLAEETIVINRTLWTDPSKMPTQAYTMGIHDILAADKILLVAKGESKAKIMEALLYGKGATLDIPASLLDLHSDATILMDTLAASQLGLAT